MKEFSFSKKCEKGKFRYRGRFLLLLNDEDFENEFFLFQKKGKIGKDCKIRVRFNMRRDERISFFFKKKRGKIGKDFGKDFARFICLEKIADI